MRFRAVIFDFFGTLTEAVIRGPAHARIARRLGCDPEAMATALNDSFRARARGDYGSPVAALSRVVSGLTGRPTDEELSRAVADRFDAILADTRLRTDAVPVLRAVRASGLGTGLISDCTSELPVFLPDLAVGPLLDVCVYSIEMGACKPDPTLYRAACDRLGVPARECLFVGDGGSRELTGAQAVGMTAVRLAAPDLSGHLSFDLDTEFRGPAIESLSALPALLGRACADRGDLILAG